jgi:hypothetical protein
LIACFSVQVYAAGTALGWWLSSAVTTPGRKKGTIMEILVVAIVAIVSFGLYRYLRTRTAH